MVSTSCFCDVNLNINIRKMQYQMSKWRRNEAFSEMKTYSWYIQQKGIYVDQNIIRQIIKLHLPLKLFKI